MKISFYSFYLYQTYLIRMRTINYYYIIRLKKIDIIKLDTLNEKQINIFQKIQDKKIFLLNFWATWCPPCIKEIPELIKLERNI